MTATIHLPELLLALFVVMLAEAPVDALPEIFSVELSGGLVESPVFSSAELVTVFSPQLPNFTVIRQGDRQVQYHRFYAFANKTDSDSLDIGTLAFLGRWSAFISQHFLVFLSLSWLLFIACNHMETCSLETAFSIA
jgi:hypothetical protein